MEIQIKEKLERLHEQDKNASKKRYKEFFYTLNVKKSGQFDRSFDYYLKAHYFAAFNSW